IETPPAPAADDGARMQRAGAATRVLFVDDEATIRQLTAQGLEGLGYTVTTAADGAEALEFLTPDGPGIDVLITDLRMPGLDGRARSALALATLPPLRVAPCSGFGDDADVTTGPPNADWTFLPKPFTLRELRRLLRAPGWRAHGDEEADG